MSRVNCNNCTVAQVIVVFAAVLKVLIKSELTVGQVVQYRTSIALVPTIEENGYLLYTHHALLSVEILWLLSRFVRRQPLQRRLVALAA